MNSKSNNPDAAVQERQTVSRNRQRPTSLGSCTNTSPQEDAMPTLPSYELGNPHQNTLSSRRAGSAVQRAITALLTLVQGCLVIFYVATVVSAGSWSLWHQWTGYTVLMLSIVLLAVLRLIRRFGIKSRPLMVECGAGTTNWGLSRRVHRSTGLALLMLISATALSGWMCTLDFFWGLVWIEGVHLFVAYAATALFFIYGAVVFYFILRSYSPDRFR